MLSVKSPSACVLRLARFKGEYGDAADGVCGMFELEVGYRLVSGVFVKGLYLG